LKGTKEKSAFLGSKVAQLGGESYSHQICSFLSPGVPGKWSFSAKEYKSTNKQANSEVLMARGQK